MHATFTAKTLNAALTLVRKGAKVRTGEKWLESADHRYGTDHVLIRVAGGVCTLYTVSQPGEGQACTYVRCERLAHVAYIDGEIALPIRVIHDYVKTFSANDEIRLTADDVRVVVDTPASHTYHTEANTYKRVRTEIPATYRDEYAVIVTSGRNRARIIGKPLASLAWMGDALLFGQVTPSEQAAADFAALRASITPAYAPVVDASPMLGPAYVAPLGTPPGYVGPIAPTQARIATPPTPIYTPVVGDTVFVVYAHENGTTTDRVIDVQRITESGFRGYDRRYGKTRNYYTNAIRVIRRWDGLAVYDHNGRVAVEAAA